MDVVQKYVDLRPSGRSWIGPCPFHQETKPSFSVFPDDGRFYCFGCQAAGDVIDFLSRITGLDFKETVLELARDAGLEVEMADKPNNKLGGKRIRYLKMHQLAKEFFQGNLEKNGARAAREYIQHRGIAPDIVEHYALGWAGNGWHELELFLQKMGFEQREGVEAGLLSENRQGRIYDRFRARLTFPIFDLRGKAIAFGGRSITGDNGPKYLNSSDTLIYKKGEHLYGLFQARKAISKQHFVYLTEGYIDVLTLAQFGFLNAVAALGTALTPSQVKRLSGLCKKVVLLFDGDQAGSKAALKSAELFLQNGMDVRVVTLPQGEDIDSFLRSQRGKDHFLELQGKAKEGLVFCMEMINLSYSPREIISWACSFLSGLNDMSLLAFYLPRLARGLGLDEKELRQSLAAVVSSSSGKQPENKMHKKGVPSRDIELLGFVITFPDYLSEVKQFPVADLLQGEKSRVLWEKILSCGPMAVQLELTAEERELYFAAQAQWQGALNKEEAWHQIKTFLGKKSREMKRKELVAMVVKAQRSGDPLAADLLRQYNSLLREVE